MERAERELEDVNEIVEEVLDGSAPAARMVFRLQPPDRVPSPVEESATRA